VPNGDNITLAELLEMRSGLYDYAGASELPPILDNDPTMVWAPQELLAISFAQPANFPPGTSYEYSNTNYVLLGLVVEKVNGRPLAKAMQKRLFRPLSLSDTVYPASTSNVSPGRSRTATCTAALPSSSPPSRTRPTPRSTKRRSRPARSSPQTTPA